MSRTFSNLNNNQTKSFDDQVSGLSWVNRLFKDAKSKGWRTVKGKFKFKELRQQDLENAIYIEYAEDVYAMINPDDNGSSLYLFYGSRNGVEVINSTTLSNDKKLEKAITSFSTLEDILNM